MEINLSAYFKNINGTAVFYNPTQNEYKIHNLFCMEQCYKFGDGKTGLGVKNDMVVDA